MGVETDEDLAVFFNTDEFAKAATYLPPGGGAGVPCSLLVESGDRQVAGTRGRPVMAGATVCVRRSEVASPAPDGAFRITETGKILKALGDPASFDEDRKLWMLTALELAVSADSTLITADSTLITADAA